MSCFEHLQNETNDFSGQLILNNWLVFQQKIVHIILKYHDPISEIPF